MAKKKNKYYVVTNGRKTGIFGSWTECEEQVKGFSGAEYKGFPNLESAKKYLDTAGHHEIASQSPTNLDELIELNEDVVARLMELKPGEVLAATDGSSQSVNGGRWSSYGAVIVDDKSVETQLYKRFTPDTEDADFLEQANVTAELEGVKAAINWAIQYKKRKITILYDYQEIEKWATKKHRAKNKYTKEYVQFIDDKKSQIEIQFIKVPSHSGIELNEKADQLADFAITAKGYKSYNDGTMYFTGITEGDWKTIVEILNKELQSLGSKEQISISSERTESSKAKMILRQQNSKVTISIYGINKSYVQGKDSSLMSRVMYEAIALCDKCEQSIEQWNAYYRLPIQKDAVLSTVKQFLPDLNENETKLFNTLSSAVYNLMLQGYMPDYTCLLQPAIRALEAYLHRILNGKMNLQTSVEGKNKFSYFSTDSNGEYYCNRSEVSVLSIDQKEYLNRLYNIYSRIRHPYSHWSLDPNETRVIDSIDMAQDLIKECLETINEYYNLF